MRIFGINCSAGGIFTIKLLSGNCTFCPVNAAASFATPTKPRQSARLGVKSSTKIGSSRPRAAVRDSPTAVSGSNTRMPSTPGFKGRSNSAAEHNIPFDSMPRSLARFIFTPPGSTAPGLAKGTLSPGLILSMPATTVMVV